MGLTPAEGSRWGLPMDVGAPFNAHSRSIQVRNGLPEAAVYNSTLLRKYLLPLYPAQFRRLLTAAVNPSAV